MTTQINTIQYPFDKTGFNYCDYFTQHPELKVMLNDVEYENNSGWDTGKPGGYYVDGYSSLDGFSNVYLKIYSVIHGTVQVVSTITINRQTDKTIKYMDMLSGRDDSTILSPAELEDRLKHFIKKRCERSPQDMRNVICDECGESADILNQMDGDKILCCPCEQNYMNDDEEFYEICYLCNKMDEACLCDSNPNYQNIKNIHIHIH